MPYYYQTPLFKSEPLSRITGKDIYLKFENLQPSGSFKNRGMGHLLSHLAKEGSKGFVIASGGNAGLAVAYTGRRLGLPVTVLCPKTTLPLIKEKIEAEGASFECHEGEWEETRDHAKEIAQEKGYDLISPYDHPLIWEGNSTMVDEIAASGIVPDTILLSVGGGGMMIGVLQGMHRAGWKETPVLTSETVGSSSFYQAIQAGKPVKVPIQTIATSLGCPQVADEAFAWTKRHPIVPHTVTDKEAAEACYRFCYDHEMIVEPSTGAALAILYDDKGDLSHFKTIVVIICGGCVVSPEMILHWKNTL